MSKDASSTAAPPKRPRGMGRTMLRVGGTIHRFMYRRGLARKMGQMQQVLLTTTGRKSGKPHTVPLGAIREGDGWVVIASFGGADVDPSWWLNMKANPDVTVQVNDQVIKAANGHSGFNKRAVCFRRVYLHTSSVQGRSDVSSDSAPGLLGAALNHMNDTSSDNAEIWS